MLKSRDLFYVQPDQGNGLDLLEGLFALDTRYLNRVEIRVGGQLLVARGTSSGDLRTRTYVLGDLEGAAGGDDRGLPQELEITVTISLDTVLELAFVIEGLGTMPSEVDLSLGFSADFRDLFEFRGWVRREFGSCLPPILEPDRALLRYRAHDGHRLGTEIQFDPAPTFQSAGKGPEGASVAVARYQLQVEPGTSTKVQVVARPQTGGRSARQVTPGADALPPAQISTDNPGFNRLLDRSLDDLEALLTRFPDGEVPAAGIPWYVAPFGRDSLISGWQTFHVDPGRAAKTLHMLARLQGRRSDPITGEQPGKIMHEARYGELARLGEIPHRPYYGTIDATSLYLLLAAETVAWTGDYHLLKELRPTIDSALTWIDDYGDPDGDGLLEYWLEPDRGRLLPLTARHHSWKDSDDSLHHPDGREPHGHIAPVEAQGYTYAALTRLAEVLTASGETDSAAQLLVKAAALKQRVEEFFWIEKEGYYAQALDGDKRQVRAISSNPGQLLLTGMVAPHRTRAMVGRLSRPDLDSGWGIRTLSSKMATYDPASYHNGSVWPHDNHLIADGCYRTGHVAMGNRIFSAMFEAGISSLDGRLDELYCGDDRKTQAPISPVPYPQACRPQAWAAGVYPGLVRSALGFRVDPKDGVLLVSPALPGFLGEVEIEGLRVLGDTGSVAVRRRGDRLVTESSGIAIRTVPHRES